MDTHEISIATMTWARHAHEEQLLREALTELARLEVPTFLTDAGSGRAFIEFLHGFPHFTVHEAKESGLWPQVRRSIQAAAETGAPFILYTEPDKRDFFRGGLTDFISEAPNAPEVGIVLAARSAAGFLTFPEFQRFTETAINRCGAEVTGASMDFTYGPFLINRALVSRLTAVREDLGWGWRLYAFGLAHRLGLRIEERAKDFLCPLDQRGDDGKERLYRMRQLRESIDGLLLSQDVPTNPSPLGGKEESPMNTDEHR